MTRDTILVRSGELTLTVGSAGSVAILRDDAPPAHADFHALSVLDAFSEPRTVEAVATRLAAESAADFGKLVRTILALHEAGVLVEPGAPPRVADGMGWDASSIHARMLRDVGRTDAFLRAIAEVVGPDDVVVDIGTGTGVLALAAARAGARRVFAVEASSIADVAQAMFSENGFADRIELVRGWSTRVSLSEKATVLVTETLGHQALGENIVETMLDAGKRLLVPGARVIPSRIRIYAQPCEMSDEMRSRHLFTRENAERWERLYGFRCGPLVDAASRSSFAVIVGMAEARTLKKLGPPALLADIDPASPEASFDRRAVAKIEDAGRLDGFLEFFELTLSPSVAFSAHPDRTTEESSWCSPVWVTPVARAVRAGDEVELRYRYLAGRAKLVAS